MVCFIALFIIHDMKNYICNFLCCSTPSGSPLTGGELGSLLLCQGEARWGFKNVINYRNINN
jgi:hypothetical protein